MKSQVAGILHVLQGVRKDVLAAYPALEDDLSKDFERIARNAETRGLGLFTLDLPHLESLLLRGLESGSLVLEGPLTNAVSKRIRVPRLFSGLWLLVFSADACLRQDVDVTALFFLRQLLVTGKKIEVECTPDRTSAVAGAYHDIERKLRSPSLGWACDSLDDSGFPDDDGDIHCQWTGLLPLSDSPSLGEEDKGQEIGVQGVAGEDRFRRLHLVQAKDYSEDSINRTLPLFKYETVDDSVMDDRRRQDLRLLVRVQQVADLIVGSFEPLDPVSYSGYLEERGQGIGFRHGPGAVAEGLKNWEKSQFPNWPHKLQNVFPYELCGTTAGSEMERPRNHEVASRLIAVPKTAKGPRLIAAEPAAHQWCQQLVLRYLFDQCRKTFGSHFIDFRDQSKSGDLVLAASLDRSLATVDLSDASDRLTCWTVERVFRACPNLLRVLHAARTRYLRDNVTPGGGGFLKLRKFASQGTATTFPVMSIVMLVIALGASLEGPVTWHAIRKLRSQVRVFGDDIIIPAHGYARLVRIMELLELKVNVAKSYVSGGFRESCGVDGYDGYDVTPVKPKTLVADSPASCQAVVDISNNLYMKGMWHASTACLDLLPARLRRGIRVVGIHDAGFRGLTSYTRGDESHLVERWNSRFHRFEVRVWALSLKLTKRPRGGHSAFLDFIAREHNPENARVVSEYADVRKTRVGLQWEPSNPDARLPLGHERLRSRLHRGAGS